MPTAPDDRGVTVRRRALLDAGVAPLLAGRPWSAIRMADVAAAAGVSRQTLYVEFGSREGLARAYVGAEAERFLAMVHDALEAHPGDVAGAVGTAFEAFLVAAAAGGLLAVVVSGEGNEELLALLTTRGSDVVDMATDELVGYFARHWPDVARADAGLVARTVVRLALSHATLPEATPAETAAGVVSVLGPHLRDITSPPRRPPSAEDPAS